MNGLRVAVIGTPRGYAMQVLPDEDATQWVEALQVYGEVTVINTNQTTTRGAHAAAERWLAEQEQP